MTRGKYATAKIEDNHKLPYNSPLNVSQRNINQPFSWVRRLGPTRCGGSGATCTACLWRGATVAPDSFDGLLRRGSPTAGTTVGA